ncbi:hypothetical protein [Sorangium sp. So ce1099]|uniref:hypothetical protein n=1 Tax=Sorangium sp. So ce1099 TaxID=3133331 RepID=UPI003F5FA31B
MNHQSFRSLGVALALTLGACGPGEDGDATGGTGSGGASGGAVGSGGQSPAGGGGTPQETGGASSGGASGGATSTGGAGPSGGTGGGPGAERRGRAALRVAPARASSWMASWTTTSPPSPPGILRAYPWQKA